MTESLEQKTLLTAPVIASLTVDTGADPSDFVTNDSSFSLSGTGDPSTIIDIERDSTIISGAVVGSNGAWTFSDSLGDGTFQYVAISNAGERSASVSVVIDTMAPAAPGTPDLDAGSDNGISSTDNLTNDNTPTFNGTGKIGASIEIFNDANSNNTVDVGEALATGTVDGSGNWTATSGTVADGTHSNVKSIQTDLAGNVSAVSGGLSVTIDTAPRRLPERTSVSVERRVVRAVNTYPAMS
jgi:hypothetical protein